MAEDASNHVSHAQEAAASTGHAVASSEMDNAEPVMASSAASSVSSELSSTPSKAASDGTADTSIAGDDADRQDAPNTDSSSSSSSSSSDHDQNATTSSSTTTTGTAKATDIIEVLAEKPGYRKELRTSANGNKYLIETQGLWTTLRSLTPVSKKRSVRERMRKKLIDFATFWPFLIRFAKEVINLGRWRFLLHLVASTLTGLTPALRIYLSGRLISMAQEASEKRNVRKAELFMVAGSSYLSSFLETWIDSLLANNNGILQRRFQAMVSEHLISARARLDVHTLGKTRVIRDFSSAASLVHALGDGTFVIGQLIDLFTSSVSLVTQASMLWKMTTKENADLALISVFSASISLVRWFWRSRRGYAMSSITDANYNRMMLMEDMSHPSSTSFGERKVLGLGEWVHEQYKTASNALGDVSLSPPRSTEMFTSATEAIRSFTDTAIIVLFSLKVAEKPIGQAAMSMSSLTFIQSATRNLASSIYRFVYDVQHFGDELSAFKSYYRVLEIKSAIKEPEEPVKYETIRRVIKEDNEEKEDQVRSGMEVEFRDVCYTWPGRKEKALDHISFTIKAGELTAIVGYNGAGKSTIIALIARLCDPSSGEILINGHDIRSYKTSDLHKAMSFLFQSSADLPLTIQEYIGVGNLDEINNLQKIRQAATDSGAIEFIDKLEGGFQSSFTGQVETETPDTLYKDAVAWDKYLSEMDDEDHDKDDEDDDDSDNEDKKDEDKASSDEDKKEETDTEGREESDKKDKKEADKDSDSDSTSGSDSDSDSGDSDSEGRLAFSGGQRQKLILARSFLRDNCDLAIFDEYSANLDPLAEHSLFQKITAKRGKQTLLYITHRYSTVRHADRILMLEKGKVIECGTHEELMAIENGKYAEMSRLALGEVDINKPKDAKDASTLEKKEDSKTEEVFAADQETAVNTPLPMSRAASPEPR